MSTTYWPLSHLVIMYCFLCFGVLELVANTIYLTATNGLVKARRQHTELPKTATDTQVLRKCQFMIATGALFCAVGWFNLLSRQYVPATFGTALIMFALYAAGEALSYRQWKTTGLFVVSLLAVAAFTVFGR